MCLMAVLPHWLLGRATHPVGKGGAASCWPGASTCTTAKCWVISIMSSKLNRVLKQDLSENQPKHQRHHHTQNFWQVHNLSVISFFSHTVEADVVVGENDRAVAFRAASHGHMEHTMGRLNVMLLEQTTRSQIQAIKPLLKNFVRLTGNAWGFTMLLSEWSVGAAAFRKNVFV